MARALAIAVSLLTLGLFGVLIWLGYSVTWTGFSGSMSETGEAISGKTLWDWLELLVVPLVLAIGAYALEGSRKRSEQRIEADRQRQQVLDDYFSSITELLLTGKLSWDDAGPSKSVPRTRTLTALRQLDGHRKAQLVQFIYEAGLIGQPPIIQLNGADLCEAALSHATLSQTELRGVHFRRASLKHANLVGADLRGSDFSQADFRGANLHHANLTQAIPRNAVTTGAEMNSAILSDVDAKGTKPRLT